MDPSTRVRTKFVRDLSWLGAISVRPQQETNHAHSLINKRKTLLPFYFILGNSHVPQSADSRRDLERQISSLHSPVQRVQIVI